MECRVKGQTDGQRILDRPGLNTPGEDAAWDGLRERVVITLRPIGAPTSIGFFGLAAATFCVAGLQLGWVDQAEGKRVALVLIGFAFVAQLIAGIFSFLGRDGVAATAMLTLALTWLVVGATLWTSKPGSTSDVLGLFLLFGGSAMALLAATAALSKLVPALVFAIASIRFLLTGIYQLSSHHGWEDAAGIVGLVLFVVAMYAAWASALEDASGQTMLPFGRRGKAKIAIHGSLLEQVKDTPTEAGVRVQL
jgi:succinate-acetate transporter protein